MEGYLAQIMMFGGNFAPRDWAFCHGQLLPIAPNTALFSLLGVTYGGNGQTTFALPDLRGRVPVGFGQGPGLFPIGLGEMSGTETITLLSTQMPHHTHQITSTLPVSASNARTSSPVGNILAVSPDEMYAPASAANGTMEVTTTAHSTGGNQPFSIMQPYLGMNYIICLSGVFPSRS